MSAFKEKPEAKKKAKASAKAQTGGYRRVKRLEARVTPEQKKLLEHAASLSGRSLTDFMIAAIQEVACRTIREHETITLGQEDREVFVNALLEEPEPTEKAKQAAERYLKNQA
ncbi:MAG: DUF1778 domain-containing protein [Desulfovermiculus sp.]|nr:DUF1778 domain-containing protein [Desulfovermiculus sp.]